MCMLTYYAKLTGEQSQDQTETQVKTYGLSVQDISGVVTWQTK